MEATGPARLGLSSWGTGGPHFAHLSTAVSQTDHSARGQGTGSVVLGELLNLDPLPGKGQHLFFGVAKGLREPRAGMWTLVK